MKNNLFILSALATIAFVAATNYCEMTCKDNRRNIYIKHIGCGHNNEFEETCPEDAKIVPATTELKKIIVDVHNKNRNFIAGGGDRRYNPACRMATMQWDEELAKLAELNVKQCRMEHDKCHNTDAFQSSGQNLAWRSSSARFDDTEKWNEIVESWFSEKKDCKQSIIDKFPSKYPPKPAFGHFTVMMAERNTRVGCAAATYTENGMNVYLLACNYATTNISGFRIYESCDRAGMKCATGMNKRHKNLCSRKEHYDVNKLY